MRFNIDDIKTIKIMAEMFMTNIEDPKQSARIHNIIDKCDACLSFRLKSRISPERKSRCNELVRAGAKMVSEYSGYAGDMGMINEYDRMKKEIAVISDSIGDVEGQLRADAEMAKRELEVVLERIKDDILANDEAKSNAEAERKAKTDMRFTVAMEDYGELVKYATVIKNKYRSLIDTRDDLRQSVSTARNSIVAEGYNK